MMMHVDLVDHSTGSVTLRWKADWPISVGDLARDHEGRVVRIERIWHEEGFHYATATVSMPSDASATVLGGPASVRPNTARPSKLT